VQHGRAATRLPASAWRHEHTRTRAHTHTSTRAHEHTKDFNVWPTMRALIASGEPVVMIDMGLSFVGLHSVGGCLSQCRATGLWKCSLPAYKTRRDGGTEGGTEGRRDGWSPEPRRWAVTVDGRVDRPRDEGGAIEPHGGVRSVEPTIVCGWARE